MQVALDGDRRAVDVGEVAVGDGTSQVFAVMAGMGLDAAMVDDAPTALKARVGPLAYVYSALKHLADDEMRVEVRVDDLPVLRRRARSVLVANVGRLQGGVDLLPDAEAGQRAAGGRGARAAEPRALGAAGRRGAPPRAAGCPTWRCCAVRGSS